LGVDSRVALNDDVAAGKKLRDALLSETDLIDLF